MMPLIKTLTKFTPEADESACWGWSGSKDTQGYGIIYRMAGGVKRQWKAHRVAYEAYIGPISDELHVRHKCDNPSCVNPDHLELGTQADNNRDRDERGRLRIPTGANHGMTKLTDEQVASIKGEVGTLREIGDKYGVHLSTISNIRLGKTWGKGTGYAQEAS